MKKCIPIISLFLFSLGQLWAQDNLDFLDKVNEKPKTTNPVKVKEEPVSTIKKNTVATVPTKKKKSKKKKNSNPVLTESTNTSLTPNNTNTQTSNIVNSETKTLPILVAPNPKQEEELVLNGRWIDPEVSIEPNGLPGFSSDLSYGKSQGLEENKSGSPLNSVNKPLFSFSEFFDKYKKAMMILGIIILFAFYRLRMAKPSSSSRPYRR